ncbi:MAG: hypothetical protein COY80_01655 [Candidatus Pacebacteria bacterium CG_4_10_14_0_8_um_filter_42_14]|nr:MAG: hypothetical protein COY80_01655 [Candidatus Pacebacteria bacterium CG_4_10_14_0_8_um_filter_42_14]
MARTIIFFIFRLAVLCILGVFDRALGFPILLIASLFILTRHKSVFQSLFWISATAILAALLYHVSPTALVLAGVIMVRGTGELEERGWPIPLILSVMVISGAVILRIIGEPWVWSGSLILTTFLQIILVGLMLFVTTPLLRRRAQWIWTGIKQA